MTPPVADEKRRAEYSSSHELKGGGVILIREAVAGDARSVLDYVEVVCGETDFLTFGPGEFELGEAEEAEYLESCRAAEGVLYLLALIDGEIVGTLNFASGRRRRVRHTGELGMSVRSPWWRQGIGSLLLDALLEWAREGGMVRKINLRVRTDNARAIALYEQRGFAHEGTISREIQIGGRFYDHHCMGLAL